MQTNKLRLRSEKRPAGPTRKTKTLHFFFWQSMRIYIWFWVDNSGLIKMCSSFNRRYKPPPHSLLCVRRNSLNSIDSCGTINPSDQLLFDDRERRQYHFYKKIIRQEYNLTVEVSTWESGVQVLKRITPS